MNHEEECKELLKTSNSSVRLTIELRTEKTTRTVSVFLIAVGRPLGTTLPHSGCLSSPSFGKPASVEGKKNDHRVPMSKQRRRTINRKYTD